MLPCCAYWAVGMTIRYSFSLLHLDPQAETLALGLGCLEFVLWPCAGLHHQDEPMEQMGLDVVEEEVV